MNLISLKLGWLKTMQRTSFDIRGLRIQLFFHLWADHAATERQRMWRNIPPGIDLCDQADYCQQRLESIRWQMSDAALQHQTAANNRQQLHRLLKQQLRKDKANYIEKVLVETQRAVEAGYTRTFFNKIKHLRPKTKKPLPALRRETDSPLSTYGAMQGAFLRRPFRSVAFRYCRG